MKCEAKIQGYFGDTFCCENEAKYEITKIINHQGYIKKSISHVCSKHKRKRMEREKHKLNPLRETICKEM